MQFFTSIEGSALLLSGGVYREAALFVNEKNEVFAKHGAGVIRLYPNNGTSAKSIVWREIKSPSEVYTSGCYLMIKNPLPAEPAVHPLKKAA